MSSFNALATRDILRVATELKVIERHARNRGKRAEIVHRRNAPALVSTLRIAAPSKPDSQPVIAPIFMILEVFTQRLRSVMVNEPFAISAVVITSGSLPFATLSNFSVSNVSIDIPSLAQPRSVGTQR